MGDKRPVGEVEYNPLGDVSALIGKVVSHPGSNAAQNFRVKEEPSLLKPIQTKKPENIVSLEEVPKKKEIKNEPTGERVSETSTESSEEFVTFKFKVPKSDYQQAKKLAARLEEELGGRIDLSNLGRGWITRFITAENEILDAARNQSKLRTPNSRNRLEVAEIDNAMTVIQSIAFRRAAPLK